MWSLLQEWSRRPLEEWNTLDGIRKWLVDGAEVAAGRSTAVLATAAAAAAAPSGSGNADAGAASDSFLEGTQQVLHFVSSSRISFLLSISQSPAFLTMT